jgi:pimeloyl-ACP methyl ester carboxylesterase
VQPDGTQQAASVSVADVDVHVEGQGAETIIMVHGWPDTYRLWDEQVQDLKGRYRCVRFTLPGFDVAKERRAYTLDELVGFLKTLIEEVCPGRPVILMLHDWGCVFGYQFYMRNPQMVSKIIGVDVGDTSSLRRSLTRREAAMTLAYQVWLALSWVAGGRIGDWMTRSLARLARCPSDEAWMGSCMAYPYYILWFGGARSYRRHAQRFEPACPMLFVYGRRKAIRFHAKAWADALLTRKENQVVKFDTGHWVMSDQPERFNHVVSAWLAQ